METPDSFDDYRHRRRLDGKFKNAFKYNKKLGTKYVR